MSTGSITVTSGRRPREGLRPTSPQHDAGMRTEPPPSLPWPRGTTPAATSAAVPPLEPPDDRDRSHGLRVAPKRSVSVVAVRPNSESAVFAIGERPRRSALSTHGDEAAASRSATAYDACVVG